MRISFTTYEELSKSRSGFCPNCACVTVPGKRQANDRNATTVAPFATAWICPECKKKTLMGVEAARRDGQLQIC